MLTGVPLATQTFCCETVRYILEINNITAFLRDRNPCGIHFNERIAVLTLNKNAKLGIFRENATLCILAKLYSTECIRHGFSLVTSIGLPKEIKGVGPFSLSE